MSNAKPLFTPFLAEAQEITVGSELVSAAGLDSWSAQFQLGTAGYRDLLDPDDLFNFGVPLNGLTLAIILEARARLAVENGIRSLHVGGEVRPHTQEFIDLAARLYAAHGIRVHLRADGERTTPIWLSSFGVFYDELDGGENFTASHSQSYKGGWKPMEAAGGQLLEMAGLIADRVRELVAEARGSGLIIRLASADNDLIVRDFDPVEPYVSVLKQVVPAGLLAEIPRAAEDGFRAAFCTEGGSMGPTARRIFAALGIPCGDDESVFFTHETESSTYHGIGIVDGVNHGVDPGKWQVYKNVGAQRMLAAGDCDVFFIWDPDGDRFNMVTVAPVALADPAKSAGLEVDPLDDDRCLVFFKPNQIYFMLTALKIASLAEAGELENYNWIVASTWPTSMSIGEIAHTFNERFGGSLGTFRVPVGFKYFASLVGDLEDQIAAGNPNTGAVDVTGTKSEFGPRPRMLMMAEESGGAAMGSAEPVTSRHGNRTSLAPKEKDAMQIGVMALCLAARLHSQGGSFAGYYLELLEKYETRYRFYERRDITLFDESLKGSARDDAKAAGNARKEATVAFFASLEGKDPSEAAAALVERMPEGSVLPTISRVFHAGDGTYIEFDSLWFELRASGTDAVLRYYMEGRDSDLVAELNEVFTRLEVG
jgi:phosphomannomutase